MSIFEKIVDRKIIESMQNGEFDNLHGKGKPVNLDDYFKTPPHLRISYQILKNHGITPREVELKNEMDTLRTKLSESSSAQDRKRLQKVIHYKSLLFNMSLEKLKRY
jgi:hypothetical protein